MLKYKNIAIIVLFFTLQLVAGLPPTSSKLSGESSLKTTFSTDYGAITGTRPLGVLKFDQTGTGAIVLQNSPSLITPDLGVPSFLDATNASGIANLLTSGTTLVNANLTGDVTSVGNSTSYSGIVPISLGGTGNTTGTATVNADLTGPIFSNGNTTGVTAQTGVGSVFVMQDSPALVNPDIGVATATSVNGTTIPALSTLITTLDKLNSLSLTSSAELASVISDETGSGALVFSTSPSLVTPNLGVPSFIDASNATGTAPGLTAGNVTTNANLSGDVTSVGNVTSYSNTLPMSLGGTSTDEGVSVRESGGNILRNSSFELDISSPAVTWSSSGGSIIRVKNGSNFQIGNQSFAQFTPSAIGDFFESSLTLVPVTMTGGCQADFKKYLLSANGSYRLDVLNASLNVLATETLGFSNWSKARSVSFFCPSGQTVKLRLTALSLDAISVDLAYLGTNQNIVKTAATNDYNWTLYTPVFSGFGTVLSSSCYHKRRGADLLLRCNFKPGASTATEARVWFPASLLSDGAIPQVQLVGQMEINSTGGIAQGVGSSYGVYIEPSVGYITFGNRLSGSTGLSKKNGSDVASSPSELSLYATIPISGWSEVQQQDIAISPEQSSWFIDANIGGANIGSGASALTSYTELTSAGLDLVVNSSKGSSNAEIACINGTASSGTTCPGVDESAGIAFIPPYAGSFEACASFSTNISNGNSGTFQLIETPNNTSTILQEGGDRITTGVSMTTGTLDAPFKVCGNFNFSNTSKKTIRLMLEKSTGNALLVTADRNSSVGQRDIHVTVRPMLSAFNRPILTGDQVTTPNATKARVFSFKFGGATSTTACGLGACTVYKNAGGVLTSATNASPGVYNLILDTGKFSYLDCLFSAGDHASTANRTCGSFGYNNISGTMQVQCSTANSVFNTYVSAICFGEAP